MTNWELVTELIFGLLVHIDGRADGRCKTPSAASHVGPCLAGACSNDRNAQYYCFKAQYPPLTLHPTLDWITNKRNGSPGETTGWQLQYHEI